MRLETHDPELGLNTRSDTMRHTMKFFVLAAAAMALNVFFATVSNLAVLQAQPRTPGCNNATAIGTYGYRMTGVIVGVGPFLVNGIYRHNADGSMNANVQLIVGNQ